MQAKQYVLARNRDRLGSAANICTVGGWHLGTPPDLQVIDTRLSDGRQVVLAGHPLDTDDALERLKRNHDVDAVYAFAGSYIVLVRHGDTVDLYLDPSGSLPAVYAPDIGVVAANPELIHEYPYDAELAAHFPIDEGHFFPFELTPKREVLRLLPNHRLRLSTMAVERHWPKALVAGKWPIDDNIDVIARHIEATILAVARQYEVILPLTAGYDSRALLACTNAPSVQCFTSLIDADARADARLAARLAATVRVPHEGLAFVSPTDDERAAWLASTGRCVGGRVSFNFKTIADISRDRVLVMGLAGEVGRAFWAAGVTANTKLEASDVVKKLGLRKNARSLASAGRWLDELRHFSALEILDLLYIEVRLGCWAGPQMAAASPAEFRIAPFSQRAIFERALDLPVDFRRADLLPSKIVAKLRPELAAFPYNPATTAIGTRLLKLVRRVFKKLALRI